MALFIGGGCASIVDGGDKSIEIKSNPAGAKVTITNKKGEAIFTQMTPTIVSLDRGGFFSRAKYGIHFESDGYYPADLKVASQMNGWYLGNVVFGSIIGFLIVDPATGAMWTLSPRHVSWNLVSNTTPLNPEQLKEAELKLNPPPPKLQPVRAPRH